MVKEYEPLLIFIEDHIFDKILLFGSFCFLFMSLEYFEMLESYVSYMGYMFVAYLELM